MRTSKLRQQQDSMVAKALRDYAEIVCDNPQLVTAEDAKSLDRALRSCPAISDIDRVWVRWCFMAEKHGWLTDKELIYNKNRYYQYPDLAESE